MEEKIALLLYKEEVLSGRGYSRDNNHLEILSFEGPEETTSPVDELYGLMKKHVRSISQVINLHKDEHFQTV